MQGFLKWLGLKLFPKEPVRKPRQPYIRKKQQSLPKPDAVNGQRKPVVFEPELQGRIEDGGPGKNVLVRNKYVREESGTHETLKIVDDALIDSGEESGFDPYNTGRFDPARRWSSRTGK